ncbi:MAG: TetR/AcrR family transcriptional regulator [Nostoc sp. ChiSLP01]|nr:TetR/AcrR family transcriptional regulator [Nostoc sp. CmiSLP01]MDZ8282265.1 TetR/AcrR family transcriptional regulator [Nostoc sp. ChiSLP01]
MVRQAKGKKSLNTRQVRDAEATQAVILAAAQQEFAKHGLTATRTEAIAAKTGVAKSMIYYYFKDKEGLYQAVLERSHSDILQTTKQLDLENLSPEVALETFLVALLNCVSRNPNLPLIMFHEAVQNQGQYYKHSSSLSIDKILVKILERGVATGSFRKLDPLQSAINIMGTCLFYFISIGNAQHYPQDKGFLSTTMLEQHSQEAIALILAGVKNTQ